MLLKYLRTVRTSSTRKERSVFSTSRTCNGITVSCVPSAITEGIRYNFPVLIMLFTIDSRKQVQLSQTRRVVRPEPNGLSPAQQTVREEKSSRCRLRLPV